MPSAPWRTAACTPAQRVQAHRGAGRRERVEPFASSAATHAREHVAGAGCRERRRRARADGDAAVGRGDERVVALQHDDRAGRGRPPRGRGAACRRRSSARRRPAAAPARPRAASARRPVRRAQSISPANAFRPSASSTTGIETASSSRARTPRVRSAAPEPGPEHERAAACAAAAAASGSIAVGRQAAVRVGQRDRHLLEQPRLEHQRERRRHAHGHVARAGAGGRERRQARRAGQPGRAAGDEHAAACELGRVRTAPRDLLEHLVADQADRRPSPARRAGCRCRSRSTSPGAGAARLDPQPRLGGVEGRRRARHDGEPGRLAAGGVDAARHVGREHLDTAVADRLDRRGDRAARLAAGAGSQQRVDHERRVGGDPSAPVDSSTGASPARRSRFDARHRRRTRRARRRAARRRRGRRRAARRPRPVRRRRCCPCRRRRRSAPREPSPLRAPRARRRPAPSARARARRARRSPTLSIARICSAS